MDSFFPFFFFFFRNSYWIFFSPHTRRIKSFQTPVQTRLVDFYRFSSPMKITRYILDPPPPLPFGQTYSSIARDGFSVLRSSYFVSQGPVADEYLRSSVKVLPARDVEARGRRRYSTSDVDAIKHRCAYHRIAR